MRELLYKEFRLSMHPVCYIFVLLFPFMVFIPNYPLFISLIYVCACYPILFMGANKGVQTNDLLFSVLLPVRKKDIVAARIITCCIMQFVSMGLTGFLSLPAKHVLKAVDATKLRASGVGVDVTPSGAMLGFDEMSIVFAFALLAFSFHDFLFFLLYYRNGKSILSSTLLSLFAFVMITSLFIVALPLASKGYLEFFVNSKSSFRAIFALIMLLVYIISHYFTYKLSGQLLEKVDF